MDKLRELAALLEADAARVAAEARSNQVDLESLRERTARLISESQALIDRANVLLAEKSDAE